MGTNSTVHFFEGEICIQSIYQQYDGYPEGVGRQIYQTLSGYPIENGFVPGEKRITANGISDLALLYVLDHKNGPGNLYATDETDIQEYNYEIREQWDGSLRNIRVYDEDRNELFSGDLEAFGYYVGEEPRQEAEGGEAE